MISPEIRRRGNTEGVFRGSERRVTGSGVDFVATPHSSSFEAENQRACDVGTSSYFV